LRNEAEAEAAGACAYPGQSWNLSTVGDAAGSHSSEFVGFDEPQFTQLRNGSVLLSLRRDSAGTRGQALSDDGGMSFRWSLDTIPNHAAGVQQPLITLANNTLLYAAPDHSSRRNMSVFASTDQAATWRSVRNVYAGPSGYSSLAQRASDGVVVMAYERDVVGCSGETCSIQWTLL
jgi:hypothetical protein